MPMSHPFATQMAHPILLCVPHAGREYPAEIYDALRLPPASLVRLEDRYADLLVREARDLGFPTIIAERARAWIDLNRSEQDIDPEMIKGGVEHDIVHASAKMRGGLGLIPRRLSGEGDIWKSQFSAADINHRLHSYYHPYHNRIAETLEQMRGQFGMAILLDMHSMPPLPHQKGGAAQFVIGDRFGKSAASRFSEMIRSRLAEQGYRTALNHPYSGDYILQRHGDVRSNIHAIQIEVDRSLYLDDALREPAAGLTKIMNAITDVAQMLSDALSGAEWLEAAE